MVALVSIALSVASTTVIVAIAWGRFSTRVEHLESGFKEAKAQQAERDGKTSNRIEKLEGQHSDTAVRLARIEEQQAQSISLLGELKSLLTARRRR